MKYKIALHQSDTGFGVSVPGLPGCWSQGSMSRALANIEDADREFRDVVAEQLRSADVREI